MAIIKTVSDRVPTYPGRVTLTPVAGQTNTFDMVRADQPVEVGTPINKVLMDQKADTLTKNVTVYVSTSGSNTTGDGTSTKPYATINRALQDLPKYLGGYTATINVAAGTYLDPVTISGFSGGTLKVGVGASQAVSLVGIDVIDSTGVQLLIPRVSTASTGGRVVMVDIRNSSVEIPENMTISTASGADKTGIIVRGGSTLRANSSVLTITGPAREAVLVTGGSKASIYALSGSVTGWRFAATFGSEIRFGTSSMTSTKGDGYSWGSNITSGQGNYVESGVG
jgi:hypothetical protein